MVDDQRLDGRPLVLAERGGGAGELAQDGFGPPSDLRAVGGRRAPAPVGPVPAVAGASLSVLWVCGCCMPSM
ncbi:hypothetical protein ACFQ0M_32035 [Kitasatospora aburaviensis]